jgi:tetratricopeptide (TPR) repeat protein
MTSAMREFNERMLVETSRGTHTEFMESLSPSEARVYLAAFDAWLVDKNPRATAEDYYWRSILMSYFFPDPEREEADLKCAAELDSNNVDLWVSLGHMAKDRENWNEAIAYYESGIRADPQNFFPWYGRAMVFMHLRRFDDSLLDINTAIQIHPNLSYGYETRARIYEAMGELEKAVADGDFAVQCNAARPFTEQLRDELRNKLKQKNSHNC